eukprot:scaffold753_cov390-Pavlova_lutheri.AAC.17
MGTRKCGARAPTSFSRGEPAALVVTASEATEGPYETMVYGTGTPGPHVEEGQWCPLSNNGCTVPELESVPLGVRIEDRNRPTEWDRTHLYLLLLEGKACCVTRCVGLTRSRRRLRGEGWDASKLVSHQVDTSGKVILHVGVSLKSTPFAPQPSGLERRLTARHAPASTERHALGRARGSHVQIRRLYKPVRSSWPSR